MATAEQPGQQVGGWQLVEVLGTGAFGETWLATDPSGAPAAVKLLNRPPGDELRVLSRIAHPSIVEVLGAGGGDRPYLAMELARGRTLAETGRLPEAQALAVVAAVLDALACVHVAGLTHGDVKPDNVMIDVHHDGSVDVKLIDFGLAGVRRGGTLAWASPERLRGEPSRPPGDVYAVGLVLWTLLHGELPFAELPVDKMLLRRREQSVVPSAGPDWVRELLEAMLAIDPARRPEAGAAADTFAHHGVPLPEIDTAWLRRRARSLALPGPVDGVVQQWLDRGGVSVVVGAAGSGKSLAVQRAVVELSARGASWVRVQSLGSPWSGIAAALVDPRLPGAPAALRVARDPADRAYSAARQLLRRAGGPLFVLVDDWASLDEGSRRVVRVLADETETGGVLITSETEVELVTRTVVKTERLAAWSTEDTARLVEHVLGPQGASLSALVAHVHEVASSHPRLVVDALVQAMAVGALWMASRRWMEDPARLGMLPAPDASPATDVACLSPREVFAGGLIAAHGYPMPRERLAALVDGTPDTLGALLQPLIVHGLVRVEGGLVQVTQAEAARALLGAVPDLADVHRRLAVALEPLGPSARLGWHLVHAGDPERAAALGPDCVARTRGEDVEGAAALAHALWEWTRTWELAEQLILALVGARRGADAAAFAAQLDPAEMGLETPVPLGVFVAWARALVTADRSADALTVIRQAQSRLRQAPMRGARRAVELHEVHALALSKLGRLDVAANVALAATANLPELEDVPATVDAWLRARVVAADCLQRMGEIDLAIEQLQSVPEAVGGGRPTRGTLDARLARLYWLAKRYRESAQVFAHAARQSGGLSALDRARLANNSALASFKVGDPAAAVSQWERARLIFDRLESEHARIGVQLNLCVGYLELGRWERARRAGVWAHEHARKHGEHRYEAMAAGNLGDVFRHLDRPQTARAMYTDALILAEEHDYAEEIAENLRRLGQLALEQDEPEAASLCAKAERRATELGQAAEAGRAAALLAVVEARRGDAEAASDALARGRGILAEHGDARELAEWRLCSAMVSQALGVSDRAVSELARVVLFAEEVGSVQLRARADKLAQQIDVERLSSGNEREHRMLDMAVAVAQEQDLESLLQAIAEAALELTDADRAFVLERGRNVLASALRAEAEPSPPSWTIAERSMEENREVIVADLGDRPDLRTSTSMRALDLRSVMCVPLVRASDVLGALYVDSGRAGEHELVELGRYLRALAGYAAIAIANAERVAQHDRQIEDASALAHDMRNLALVLIGLAEHVSEIETAEAETIESMSDVRQVGNQLVQMTERFLQPTLRAPEVVSLSELIGQLSSMVRHEAERRAIELVVDVSAGHVVRVDVEAMRRALFNIVHNAFKYCGDGGRVALSVAGSSDHVFFTVHDSGPGIPDDIAPYIFDYRRQGRQARQGFGIGLSVASRAVDDAGGTIRAGNHPSGGGLVTVILPRYVEP